MPDDALLQRLAEPVPGAERAGINAKYEPEYVQLDDEVAKLGSPSGGPAAIDWPLVARLATGLLREKSKDFVVACWLMRAWYQIDGVPGLTAGLTLLTRLVEGYWDDGHPALARVRARRAALGGCAEGIAAQLEQVPAPGDAVLTAIAAAGVLQQALVPRFENGDTGLGPLTHALDVLAARAAADAAEATAAAPAAAPMSGSTARPAPVRVATAVAADPGGRAEAVAALRAAAAWFRANEPHSPVALLVERAAHWSELGFPELMRELLANHAGARSELAQVLGLPSEPS